MNLNTQADGLKQKAPAAPQRPAPPVTAPGQPESKNKIFNPGTRVIAITSGKGGVGKTNVTANLAIALAQLGKKVMVLDADLGLANMDILLGLKPTHNLSHVLSGHKTLKQIIVEGPGGIKIVPGSSGVADLANLQPAQRSRIVEAFNAYDEKVDILLIDTSAGISDNVMSFVLSADEALLVTTPEPTAITDAYAIIKLASRNKQKNSMGLLVNRARSSEEAAAIGKKLSLIARKFLEFELKNFGFLLDDSCVNQCVRKQSPFMIQNPSSAVARGIRDLARKILNIPATAPQGESGLNRFLKRITNFVSIK